MTHDQEEALAVSDRIAVMRAGRVEQIATPRAIYEQPETPFVASFVGTTNLLNGAIKSRNGDATACRSLANEAREAADKAKKGYDKPAKWYELACTAGDAQACALRGELSENGLPPFAENRAAARPWFERACEGGSALGCADLGFVSYMEHDLARSSEAYVRGCKLADAKCCFEAARDFETRELPEKARAMFARACKLGRKDACYR